MTAFAPEHFCPRCADRLPGPGQCPKDDERLRPVGAGDDLSGAVLAGSYLLVRHLGAGAFGAVYQARHIVRRVDVAIKMLLPEKAQSERALARFLDEARAQAAIRSPHVVEVYDVLQSEGRWFIPMELVRGATLADVMAGESSAAALTPDRVAELAAQICDGLEAAHRAGVIHRDLKPANLLVTEGPSGPVVKIADFGVAFLEEAFEPGRTRQTVEHSTLGTPDYMSPEQCRGRDPDGRSDLYSLGVVTYELLTGIRPFTAPDPLAVMMKHCQDEPVPPRLASPERAIPAALEATVMALLRKEPADRPASARQTAEQLRALPSPDLRAEPAATVERIERVPPQLPRPRRRWVLAAGLFAVVGLVAWSVSRLAGSPTPDSEATGVIVPAAPAPKPPAPAIQAAPTMDLPPAAIPDRLGATAPRAAESTVVTPATYAAPPPPAPPAPTTPKSASKSLPVQPAAKSPKVGPTAVPSKALDAPLASVERVSEPPVAKPAPADMPRPTRDPKTVQGRAAAEFDELDEEEDE